jgi:hypothetical protein
MKKAALILGVLFVLVSSVVFWKLLHSGPMVAAELLPSTTIAFIEIPNIPAAITHWNQSELCKLISEPEIKAFLRQPLHFFYQESGLFSSTMTPPTLLDLFHKFQPGRFFAALEPSSQETSWIVGCQFFGKKSSMEEGLTCFVERLDTALGTGNETLLKVEEHHGELIKTRKYSSFSLYTALRGNWCFVSNDLEVLQKTLDLAARRTLQKEALLSSLLYQKNRHHLFSEGDLFYYATQDLARMVHTDLLRKPGSLPDAALDSPVDLSGMDTYSPASKCSPALPHQPSRLSRHDQHEPSGLALKKNLYFSSLLQEHPLVKGAQAFGASLCFIPEGMEERLFFNGDFNIEEQLSHRGLRFTQPTTLGFIERFNDWKETSANITFPLELPPQMASFLRILKLHVSSLATFLKPEITFTMNWAPSSTFPTLFLTAPEADSEKAATYLTQAASPLGTSLQTLDQGNLLMMSIPPIASTIQPTVASAHGLFFISTDPLAIKQMSTRNANAPTLETTPDFAKNANLYHEANEAFFYFASHEIFERAYTLARPSLLVGSIFFPYAKAILDFSKLPSATTVAKHLTPVVIAQSRNQEGLLIQSRGPLSTTPLFLIRNMLYQTFFPKQEMSSATREKQSKS